MARTNGYAKRFPGAVVWPGKNWEILPLPQGDKSQEVPTHTQLDERASWFYEAVGVSVGMMGRTVGAGRSISKLRRTRPAAGSTVPGPTRLRVPPNAPVEQFWSFTVYDNETRCFVDTGV